MMDAANPSTVSTVANRTPLCIGVTALAVRDSDRVAGYYRSLLGLVEIERRADMERLGTGGARSSPLSIGPNSSRMIHARPDFVTTPS